MSLNYPRPHPILRNLVIMLLLSLSGRMIQADQVSQDSGLWSQIDSNVSLGVIDPRLARYRILMTGEARFFEDFNHFTQGIVRFLPSYQFNDNITLHFGYTWIPTLPIHEQDFDEHDINQALTWTFKPDWGKLSTRTMLEWRFVTTGSQVAARFRQKIRASYGLPAIDKRLSLVGWEEVFFNGNTVDWGPQGGFDQNRAFAGFSWQMDSKGHYYLELGYMNHYIYHPDRNDLMNHMLLSSIQIRY